MTLADIDRPGVRRWIGLALIATAVLVAATLLFVASGDGSQPWLPRIYTLLGLVLVAAVVVGASVNRQPDSGMQAWTARLEAQAEAQREARIRDAWTERLTAVARARADEAYTARLDALARAAGFNERANDAWSARLDGIAAEAGAHDRAMDAWTARLNGLAEYLAGR